MTLRPATLSDIGFIRSLTTDPAYTPFIGDDDEAELARKLQDATIRVLIWGDDQPAGFAIFRECGEPSGRVELARLALARTGGGAGLTFVRALVDHAFNRLNARRIWLDASSENHRAQRVYLQAGFVEEGRLRQHWYRPVLGRTVDLMLYGMLIDDWAQH